MKYKMRDLKIGKIRYCISGADFTAKTKRDFFIHKFLFNRYGGEFTTEEEYADLVAEATDLAQLFASTRTRFHDFVLQNAPLEMLAARRDPITDEFVIVESEFLKSKARPT